MYGVIAVHKNNKLKLKRCQKRCLVMKILTYKITICLIQREIISEIKFFELLLCSFNKLFLCFNDVFSSSDVPDRHLT